MGITLLLRQAGSNTSRHLTRKLQAFPCSDTSLGTGKAVLENKADFVFLASCATTLSFGGLFVFCTSVHKFVKGF